MNKCTLGHLFKTQVSSLCFLFFSLLVSAWTSSSATSTQTVRRTGTASTGGAAFAPTPASSAYPARSASIWPAWDGALSAEPSGARPGSPARLAPSVSTVGARCTPPTARPTWTATRPSGAARASAWRCRATMRVHRPAGIAGAA